MLAIKQWCTIEYRIYNNYIIDTKELKIGTNTNKNITLRDV